MSKIFFRALLAYIQNGDQYTWKGVVIAFVMLLSSFIYYSLMQRFMYHGYNAGMNLRTIVTSAVYRKVNA